MTQKSAHTDLVKLIGDILTVLDILRTDPRLTEPQTSELDALRDRLNEAQLKLVRSDFSAGTAAIDAATIKISSANTDLKKVIGKVETFAEATQMIGKIVSIAEKLVGIAAVL